MASLLSNGPKEAFQNYFALSIAQVEALKPWKYELVVERGLSFFLV
jgi:hypothetical protein